MAALRAGLDPGDPCGPSGRGKRAGPSLPQPSARRVRRTRRSRRHCYDPDGNKTAVVSGDGNTSGTASCESSSPWVVSSPAYPAQASYQTTYAYDSAGEQVSVTTPATAAAPSGATTAGTYDAAGNALTRTDPNGVTTTWTYTPLNLAASVSYSGGSAHSVSYGHDANGNETSMTDATGSSSYIYDPFGELTSATNGTGQVTGYGYNPDGQANAITYPLPGAHSWAATTTVSYGYDNADVLTSVTDFNSHQIAITPNADGLSATVWNTGDTINATYDNTDNPSAITLKNTSSTLQSFTYSEAPSGNILNETDTPASSQTPAVYTYDAKGRVTSMTPGTGSPLNYAFDASSNLTTLPTGASTSYDKAGELTSATLSGTATSYSYNADGERLSAVQGGSTIASGTWNGAAQLTSYNDPAGNMSAASYDGNGLRATATSGTGSQSFAWEDVSPIPQVIMDTGNAYIYTDGVAPAEQVNLATGAVSYLVTDSLGSVRGVVSGSGTLTATTSYDAWGNPETAGGLSATTPFGYTGGYTDPDGLIYGQPEDASAAECVLAAIAYIAYLALAFIAPLLIYLAMKNRSPFVRFHAAQAFNLQVTGTAEVLGTIFIVMAISRAGLSLAYLVGLFPLLISGLLIINSVMCAVDAGKGKLPRPPRWLALRLIH